MNLFALKDIEQMMLKFRGSINLIKKLNFIHCLNLFLLIIVNKDTMKINFWPEKVIFKKSIKVDIFFNKMYRFLLILKKRL